MGRKPGVGEKPGGWGAVAGTDGSWGWAAGDPEVAAGEVAGAEVADADPGGAAAVLAADGATAERVADWVAGVAEADMTANACRGAGAEGETALRTAAEEEYAADG